MVDPDTGYRFLDCEYCPQRIKSKIKASNNEEQVAGIR